MKLILDLIFYVGYFCADESLEAAPEKFDVVLAPKSEWSGYYRALVANLKRNKTYAVVYYLDVGGSETVKVDSLKPATETIMRVSPYILYCFYFFISSAPLLYIKIFRYKVSKTGIHCGS